MMLNRIKMILFLCLFLFSCSTKNSFEDSHKTSLVTFEINELAFVNDNMNLSLLLKVPINIMVFNKQIKSFQSNLTIDVSVLDKENENVYFYSWDENLNLDYYEDTKSNKKHILKHDFSLPVGEYSIKIIVNDFENHLSFMDEGDFSIDKDYFVDRELNLFYKKNSNYFPYYSDLKIDSVDTLWFAFNEVDFNNVKSQYMRLDYAFYYKEDLVKKVNVFDAKKENIDFKNYFAIPLLKKTFDKLIVELRFDDIVKRSDFYFEDRVYNNYNMAMLVGPMQYVLSFSEYASFTELKLDEQIDYMENFWDIKDIEKINKSSAGKFYEFYSRVEYANESFTFFNNDGWKSDRGKIYVIHGKPKEIISNFNENGEFEVWHYNSNKKFVFINKYGNYELYNKNY